MAGSRFIGWLLGGIVAVLMVGVFVWKAPTSAEGRAVMPDLSARRAGVKNLWASEATKPRRAGTPLNIVLISIDTLRADHVSAYGYGRETTPRIDALVKQSRVFENAYSTSSFTSPSVMSFLTGKYPPGHGVRLLWQPLSEKRSTIADTLKAGGYQAAAVVSNMVLRDKATNLAWRFDHYDDTVYESEWNRPEMKERRAEQTSEAAIGWLTDLRDPSRPFFLWVHYIDPHSPYDAPAGSPRDFQHDTPQPVDLRRVAKSARLPSVTDGLEYVDRYDEEIAYADQQVGRLLDSIRASGLWNDTAIIVTSDHGEYLLDGPTDYFMHHEDVRDAVTHVPLIVRVPGRAGERIAQPVSITDIAPTILQLVGAALPADLDGRPVLGRICPRPPYMEGPDSGGSGGLHRAFVYPDRKVIIQHGLSNVPRRAWAFDRIHDPQELNPLPVDPAEPAYWMLDQMIRAEPLPGGHPQGLERQGKPTAIVASGVDEEGLKGLKSLGYVGE